MLLVDCTSSHSNAVSVKQINCSPVGSAVGAAVLPLILKKVWTFWIWLSKVLLHVPNKKHASHPVEISKIIHMPEFKHVLKCPAELLMKGGFHLSWTTLLRLPLSCATATAEVERKQRGGERCLTWILPQQPVFLLFQAQLLKTVWLALLPAERLLPPSLCSNFLPCN